MDDGNNDPVQREASARASRPMRWGVGPESAEESLGRTQAEGGQGEMLDPSWTPERGRSHVAALVESAQGR